MINQFHFLRPFWLLLLIPLAIIIWLLLRRSQYGNSWQTVCDAHLLPHLLTIVDKKKHYWPLLLLSIAWLLAVLAMAGPTWSRMLEPLYRTQQARVLAVDLSPSMLATDIQPSRIARARFKILDLLKQFRDGRTGMVAFASEAYTVSPLTQDTHTIAAMTPALTPDIMPVAGHNIGAALKKSAQLMRQADAETGTIILITDSKPTKTAIQIARQLLQQGYRTSVLGIGTLQGAPIPNVQGGFMEQLNGQAIMAKLDPHALKTLALAGGGHYATFTNSAQDINRLAVNSLDQRLRTKAKQENARTSRWHDEGRWLVLFILPLALLAFRRGWLQDIL